MKKEFLIILILLLSGSILFSAINEHYTFSSSTGTYTPISGTVIPNLNSDTALSSTIPIGFPIFCGVFSYNEVKVSSNGWIGLSSLATNPTSVNHLSATTSYPILAPLWDDLSLYNGSCEFITTGTSPDMVFTVQFNNARWNYQTNNQFDFQVKIYEAGRIEFHYGPSTGTPVSASASIGMNITQAGSQNFCSITPGNPATCSYTSENNTVSTFPGEGVIYAFDVIPGWQVIQIGYGNGSQRGPMGTLYGYERDASLYTEDLMQGAIGRIRGVSWYAVSAYNNTVPYKIYLKTTTATSLVAQPWSATIANAVLMAEGTRNIDQPGWLYFPFPDSTNFIYSGGNLVVMVETNYGGAGTTSSQNFLYTVGAAASHHYIYADTVPPGTNGYINFSRPNIGIVFSSVGIIPTISVTGMIAGSDNPTVGLTDATISLSGLENYSATTNAQGYFTITGVYPNQTYQYTANYFGYQESTGTINVGTVDYNMGTITMNELAYPPQNVVAVFNYPHLNISWAMPEESPFLALQGYKVWRLLQGQEQNETSWTQLTPQVIGTLVYTDNGYVSLPDNTYKWAVKAVYTGGVLSPPEFSNAIIGPPPHGTLAGTVRTWDNHPIEGATITAGTFTTNTNANGSYAMPLWVGTYDYITCTHPNFYFFMHGNISISEGQYTICNFISEGDDAADDVLQITKTELKRNYPNPFNPKTTISYDVKGITPVKIEIYNTKGQLVKTLVNENTSTGRYQIVWNGTDEQNSTVSSGVYLYKMQAGNYTATHRMMLLK